MQQRYVSVHIKFKAFKIFFITCKVKKWECDCHIISVVICTQRHTIVSMKLSGILLGNYEAHEASFWKDWNCTWLMSIVRHTKLELIDWIEVGNKYSTALGNVKCDVSWTKLWLFLKNCLHYFFIHIVSFFGGLFCLPASSFTTSLYHWFLPSVFSLFLPTVILFDSLPFLKEI